MHIIEKISTNTGLKIKKPFIYEKFFPLDIQKYIIFNPKSSEDVKNYDYWDRVLDILNFYLKEKDITIIQIGEKRSEDYSVGVNLTGATDHNTNAYLIKNSLLYLGTDAVEMQVASSFNIKICSLVSNYYLENVKPYWSKSEDTRMLQPKTNIKPNFSSQEGTKRINTILPEDIAYNALDLLGITHEKTIKTLYIGKNFHNKTFEIIPDGKVSLKDIPTNVPIVRMDYHFNGVVLEYILSQKKAIIITNKEIDIDLLKNYKTNIQTIIYVIEEKNEPRFVSQMENLGIDYSLVSYLKDINHLKIKYIDFKLINHIQLNTKSPFENGDKDNLFISNRLLLSSKGIFNTKYTYLKLSNTNQVPDDPLFWGEADNVFIYKNKK
jgi:hypothetical protein